MTWAMAAVAASSLIGGSMQADAATNAANTQLAGTKYASDIQKKMFDTLNEQQAPYREIGKTALTKITDMLPFFTKMPTAEDVKSIPGYQFGMNEGLGAVSQNGNVLSPGSNVDMARQKFATDYALNTALPSYLTQRTGIYNTLAGIAGLGQQSVDASGKLGMQTGSNLSQLAVGGANAIAGGQVGVANAMAGGLQGAGNAGMMYALMRPQNSSVAAPQYLG
jgi:hypothetical protein